MPKTPSPLEIKIEISPELREELERIKGITGMSSDKDLFGTSISLLRLVVNEYQRGQAVYSMDSTGRDIVGIRIPGYAKSEQQLKEVGDYLDRLKSRAG